MTSKINNNCEVIFSTALPTFSSNETNKEKLLQVSDQFNKKKAELISIQKTIQQSLDEIVKKEKEVTSLLEKLPVPEKKEPQAATQVKAPVIANSSNEDEITKAMYYNIPRQWVSDLASIKEDAEKVVTKINGISQEVNKGTFNTWGAGGKPWDMLVILRYLVLTDKIACFEEVRATNMKVYNKIEEAAGIDPSYVTTKQNLLDNLKKRLGDRF